jgi:hypothetical protein
MLTATLATMSPVKAADRATIEVSDETWQEVWSAIAPNVADKWRCYGRPREFIRDPRWVIVSYRAVTSPECEGVPTDPYPGLVTKQSGTWQDVSLLGPWPCSEAGDLAFARGAPSRVVKDLMKDGWCDPSLMWRGYMERFLNTKECPKQLPVRPNKYRVAYIGRQVDGRKMEDGAVAWTCARAAGGAQDQYLTVFLAGPQPRQLTVKLESLQFESMSIKRNRILVTGGSYSGSAPLCCPDHRVKETFQIQDGKLVRLKRTVTPL